MKKLLVLLMFLTMTISANANEIATDLVKNANAQRHQEQRMQRENAFEKRLGLTEEQKVKARKIRIDGHMKIRPIMDEIILKKQEEQMIKMSRIAVQLQEERLAQIDEKLKALEIQANKIRKENMKEFESILTWKQKKILKEMKKEGRKKYHSEHPTNKRFMYQNNSLKNLKPAETK